MFWLATKLAPFFDEDPVDEPWFDGDGEGLRSVGEGHRPSPICGAFCPLIPTFSAFLTSFATSLNCCSVISFLELAQRTCGSYCELSSAEIS